MEVSHLRSSHTYCRLQRSGRNLTYSGSSFRQRHVVKASYAGVALPTADSLPTMSGLSELDLESAKEGLAVLQQYGGKAAGVAGAGLQSLVNPFLVFGDSWFLNFLFFGIIGLLGYSLLVLAPKQ